MSLPLFLVAALPEGAELVLDGPEGHHAADVARLIPGQELLVGDGHGLLATAVVRTAGKGLLRLSVTSRRRVAPAPGPRLVVAQALAKGDRGELAVQAMTEVGVDEIIPWAAARCVVQWHGERADRHLQRWSLTAREAAKQARRAYLPVVGAPVALAGLLTRCRGAAGALVLHEQAAQPLSTAPLPVDAGPDTEVLVVVGPEGGITDAELDQLRAAGAAVVRLGDTVLRTSTAGVAALSVLNTRLSRW